VLDGAAHELVLGDCPGGGKDFGIILAAADRLSQPVNRVWRRGLAAVPRRQSVPQRI
jgi:hypothetical protein